MYYTKRIVLLAFAILLSVALAGCTAQTPLVDQNAPPASQSAAAAEQPADQPVMPATAGTAEPVTLNVNLGTEPPTLDPSLATDGVSLYVTENLFNGLTNVAGDGNVEPELATSWSVSEDGLTYTFAMREDVTWVRYTAAAGVEKLRPVTASDVVYAVRRSCDPRTASDYAYVDYVIAGCMELNTADPGTLTEDDLQALIDSVGVSAPDTYTVQFTVTTPAPYFPAIAGLWINAPQYREVIEAAGEGWTEPGTIVTNGPYVLTDWHHNDSITAEKNPFWYGWDEVAGNIDRVELAMVGDPSSAFAMYETGALDTTIVPSPDIPTVESDAALSQEVHRYPTACTASVGFTTTKPPMDNVLVRKALSAAIDRQSLIDNVMKGGQIPANTFAPAMIFGNAAGDTDIAPWALPQSMGGWGYDKALEQARQWLADAGYPDGAGFPAITLMHAQMQDSAQVMQAVQSMWQQGLGIDVTVESQEFGVYLNTIENTTPLEERPHAFRLIWCADYPDENNWVHENFNTDAGLNPISWEKDANAPLGPDGMSFNQLTSEAQLAQDPATRMELYKAAEKILVDDAAAIAPIDYAASIELTKPYLTRTYPNIGGVEWQRWVLDWAAKQQAVSSHRIAS